MALYPLHQDMLPYTAMGMDGDMYYDPYMDSYYDPYMMDAYYDPYMDPYYDPYMMDTYYDPGYAEVDDDDLDDDPEETTNPYHPYNNYDDWYAAAHPAAVDTMPNWNMMYTDAYYQTAMYDGTNRNRGTFSATNTVTSMAEPTRQIYDTLMFTPGASTGVTVEQVSGSELPAGLNIIKPIGYDHAEIYGTLPTVSELTTYNFSLSVNNAMGAAQQQFTFYVDEGGVTRVAWRDPTMYTDNAATRYFNCGTAATCGSSGVAVDFTLEATTTNTDLSNNTVWFFSQS